MFIYFWADGTHVQARLKDDAPYLLVIVGATPEGKKKLVGLVGRSRKSGWPSPAFNALVETWGYEKAVECLTNEREALVYDLPVK